MRRLRSALVLTMAFALVLAPWAFRNTRLQGVFTAVDAVGGIALMMGNYEYTLDDRAWDAHTLEGDRSIFAVMLREHPEARSWTEGQREKWAMKRSLTFMIQHPLLTVERAAIKFARFWGLDRVLVAGWQQGLYTAPTWAMLPAVALIVSGDAVVMLLAALGVLLAPPRHRQAHAFLLLLMAFVCGMHALAFGHSRYRLPLTPILLLYAAGAVRHRSWRQLREGFGRAAAPMAAWAMLLGFWAREILVVDADRVRRFLQQLLG
jgi:hypothetical protein